MTTPDRRVRNLTDEANLAARLEELDDMTTIKSEDEFDEQTALLIMAGRSPDRRMPSNDNP